MSLGKIILASITIMVVIGIIFSTSMLSIPDEEPSSEISNQPQKETIKPASELKEPQIISENKEEKIPKIFPKEKQCTGNARCISGFVTRVIDGDTITVDGQSIRFALVNTPEWGDFDYSQARAYIETICPVGSKVLVDEDDGQTEGSFGRIIAKIYCNELNLNEEILEVGHAVILPQFCPVSEFASESWAQKHGCSDSFDSTIPSQSGELEENCDPSYPDVCIPSFPPDLDCNEVSYQNFRVILPDPHNFDGDKDGVGCES